MAQPTSSGRPACYTASRRGRLARAVLTALLLSQAAAAFAGGAAPPPPPAAAPGASEGGKPPLQHGRPYVVAHRGASGLLPEHTLPAYRLAIEQGADFIECDVQVTRDLALVCRHDPALDSTTDAGLIFRDRTATHTIDSAAVTGVFVADLTLAEVRRLHARQRWAFRDHGHDGRYGLVTFGEFLDLALAANRTVGVYPEAKHPTWHNQLPALRAANTTIEQLMVAELHSRGYAASSPAGSTAWRAQPIYIQSFEVSSLRRASALTRIPLALLVGGWEGGHDPDTGLDLPQMTSDSFLATLSPFVTVVAPWKVALFELHAAPEPSAAAPGAAAGSNGTGTSSSAGASNRSSSGSSRVVLEASQSLGLTEGPGVPWLSHPDVGLSAEAGRRLQQQQLTVRSTGLAERLRRHGFEVHTFTLRDESRFVLPTCAGQLACELDLLFGQQQVDAGFADFPGTVVQFFHARQH